jgi:glyoxylase-like metal-dependent hydrolase (beta-lactamase superfamily II)
VSVKKIHPKVSLIDLHDLQQKERTGAYILHEKAITIIETSASPSIPYLKAGLKDLNISLEEIHYIIVTHIHLDHAGGVGLLLQECPNAKVIVHPKGAKHLINPSKLAAGAKSIYGDRFETLFDPIIPISEDKVIIKNNKDTLTIGNDCTLTFYDTPGHSRHHFSIYHPASNGIFAGDTAGIHYPAGKDHPAFFLPSTSPNQFDPKETLSSLELFEEMQLSRIYFGHYGMSENVPFALTEVKKWLKIFVETSRSHFSTQLNFKENTEKIKASLKERVNIVLKQRGFSENHPIHNIIDVDLMVSSMGLVDYLTKEQGANKI